MQTAMYSGTPVVGVAMQEEQQGNLDNVVMRGAGIRIAQKFWTAEKIRRAVKTVLNNPQFNYRALSLQSSVRNIDGHAEAGKAILELIESLGL